MSVIIFMIVQCIYTNSLWKTQRGCFDSFFCVGRFTPNSFTGIEHCDNAVLEGNVVHSLSLCSYGSVSALCLMFVRWKCFKNHFCSMNA